MFVLSRPLLAQATTLPGILPLVTLNPPCLSPLISGFQSPPPASWDLYSIPHWHLIGLQPPSAVTALLQVTDHLLIRQSSCH